MSNHVTLEVKNASSMNAYIALPEGEGPFPGIIVFQEAFGVNTYIRRVTDRLARNGYVPQSDGRFDLSKSAPSQLQKQSSLSIPV